MVANRHFRVKITLYELPDEIVSQDTVREVWTTSQDFGYTSMAPHTKQIAGDAIKHLHGLLGWFTVHALENHEDLDDDGTPRT